MPDLDQPLATRPGNRLVVSRTIHAPAQRIFEAWTRPEHLRRWWGPASATCPAAEVDLRVGGRYRIGNLFPDGRTVWITGEFEAIEPPNRLVYTWSIEPDTAGAERVTVQFEPVAGATNVIVVHERIADEAAYVSHEGGWTECLQGLSSYLET